jgi:nicotinate dehydrogenase subunit A
MKFTLRVNGKPVSVDVAPETPLLYVLRNDLKLDGPKFGCGLGQCGACTVIVQGRAVRSCSIRVDKVEGKPITTLEGLGTPAKPHPVQAAFIQAQAAQCGYCINGMIMTAAAFLERNPNPTEPAIRQALSGNLCRCGTHLEILQAVRIAANAERKRDSAQPQGAERKRDSAQPQGRRPA